MAISDIFPPISTHWKLLILFLRIFWGGLYTYLIDIKLPENLRLGQKHDSEPFLETTRK